MRKSWPFVTAVIVVGGLAGVAIAGRPKPADTFVLDPNQTVVTEPPTSTSPPTSTTVAEAATTTTAEATTTTVVAETTTVAPSTTEVPTTIAQPTTTVIAGPLPRDEVRLVIANGDGRFRLASITADRMRPLGYIVNVGDIPTLVDATIIYYRPGFDDEAAIVAVDDEVPDAILAPLPDKPVTNADSQGDVILVLGPDAPR
jgi:hypothetical protein